VNHVRHCGIYDASQLEVTLIGAGGIGALAGITLAKMGIPYMKVWDDDIVSPENLPTQFHRVFDVESPKVIALANAVNEYSDETKVFTVFNRITGDLQEDHKDVVLAPVIISAVDSINARKDIWEVVKSLPFLWYLDARMGAENFILYTVRRGDHDWYDDALSRQDESAVADLPCTAKATIYCSALSAAYIGRTVRMIATGVTPPKLVIVDLINDVLTRID
jgi:molybdopterin/thiamine biosynthesis adenylyltransferase